MECILSHNTFPSATVFSFYMFTLLMFRKLNKPQLAKNKQQHVFGIRAFDSRLYLDISRSFKWKESFIFRYFKVFQLSHMFTCGLSDLLSCGRFVSCFCIEPRPIVFKEWRDTKTFSNLKSTHCTLLMLLIINLFNNFINY